MSYIEKKDIGLLLDAGFSEEDLGLVDSGVQGVEIYETPESYFAHELIENACEQGECSLMDEPTVPDEIKKERPDTSRPGIYDDHEYDGNEDYLEGVDQNLREQVTWLRTIKLGKMSVWQRRNKNGNFEWPVQNLRVEIPAKDKERYNKMPRDWQKEFWINCARNEWKALWESCTYSLRHYLIEETTTIDTKNGYPINLIVISADNIRACGYNNMPSEARWITMIYWDKDINKK
jgi:hypothetical protein